MQREIMEKVGIQCTGARCFGSQPWPVPANLMIGCFAKVSASHLSLDPEEIEFADWFTRNQLDQMLSKSDQDYMFPQPISIAYPMIKHWMERC
jgi:NAD+ diphosphatase